MPSVSVNCPGCGREYKVPTQHLGKKVKCATASCAQNFIAEPKVIDEPEPDDDVDEGIPDLDIESAPLSKKKPFQKVAAEKEPAEPSFHFARVGRLLAYSGFFLLMLATLAPSTVPVKETGGIFGGMREIHNMPAAAAKSGAALIGVAMLIAGATFWSASNSPPSSIEFWILFAAIVVLIVAIANELSGPVLARFAK